MEDNSDNAQAASHLAENINPMDNGDTTEAGLHGNGEASRLDRPPNQQSVKNQNVQDKEVANKNVKKDVGFTAPVFAAPIKAVNKRKSPITSEKKRSQDSEEHPQQDNYRTNESSKSVVVDKQKASKLEEPVKQKLESGQKKPQIPFKPPNWCSKCTKDYSFEILKNGVMKGKLDLTEKPYYTFGRLEGCDVIMEHPSISRYHAVVVYKGDKEAEGKISKVEEGFYIMDLGSTHGTIINKTSLQPKVYHRIRVGYVVKFGGSSRLYILEGPREDQDEEMDMNIIKQKIEEKKEEIEDEEENEEDDGNGISWGMGEDAVEEEFDLEKILASRKPLELKDPKKTLRGFFEREGVDLEYESDERGTGSSKVFVIRVRLPIEDAAGEELIAEGTSTKKKDAVVACAYEACRIIDAHGMLRNALHESESSKRAKRLAENDYYDSDEDSFLDRTGAVELKRRKRLRKAGKEASETVETYDSLKKQFETCMQEIESLEKSLEDDKIATKSVDEDGVDELDQFMSSVSSRLDKKTRISMKHRLAVIRKEQRRLERLIAVAKPTELPPLIQQKTIAVNERKADPAVENEIAKPEEDMRERQTAKSEMNIDKGQTAKETESQDSKKRKRIVGLQCNSMADVIHRIDPTLARSENAETPEEIAKSKKKNKKKLYGPQTAPVADAKFSDWVPPSGQTGDGKTRLNEKFGY